MLRLLKSPMPCPEMLTLYSGNVSLKMELSILWTNWVDTNWEWLIMKFARMDVLWLWCFGIIKVMRNIDFILLRVTCTAHIHVHVIGNMGRHTQYDIWSTFPAISCQTSMGTFGELLLLRGSFFSMIFFQTAIKGMKELSNYTSSLTKLNLLFNGPDF